jgi:RND family efflux transporter MFP subunit
VAERKAQYLEFKAALEQAQIDIRNSSIKAPYDSVIIEKHIEVGGYVNVGARVVTLSNDKSVEVEADIPSFRLLNLGLGTKAKVITDSGKKYNAQVRAIIPNENVRTRTRPIRLTADFGEDASNFADNQSVRVELPLTNENKVLTVNKDAVLRRANGNIVFVVKGTNAMMRSVRLGRGIGNKYQVINGLKAGDKVVVRGNERLGAGGKIRIAK